MWIYVLVSLLVVIVLYIFITINTLIKLSNKVDEAFSTMDVYLKKRWDLIPNLVDVVKGYMSHEKDTLEEIIKLRNCVYDNMDNEQKMAVNSKLIQNVSRLIALTENYPELKASENFNGLSNQLVSVENDIVNSRKYFNAVVRLYNNKVEMIPSNIIAKIMGYKIKKMFEIDKSERENISIGL